MPRKHVAMSSFSPHKYVRCPAWCKKQLAKLRANLLCTWSFNCEQPRSSKCNASVQQTPYFGICESLCMTSYCCWPLLMAEFSILKPLAQRRSNRQIVGNIVISQSFSFLFTFKFRVVRRSKNLENNKQVSVVSSKQYLGQAILP